MLVYELGRSLVSMLHIGTSTELEDLETVQEN